MGEIYPLLDFLEVVILLVALMLVDLLAYQLPLLCPIIDRYLPHTFPLLYLLLYFHSTILYILCAGFMLFSYVVIYCHLQAFPFYTSNLFHFTLLFFTVACCH